jgi:hypothetical protein
MLTIILLKNGMEEFISDKIQNKGEKREKKKNAALSE